MNERIRELVLEAGFVHYGEDMGFYNIPVPAFNSRIEKFAELIVRECIKEIGYKSAELLDIDMYRHYQERLKKHFGVEE